MSLSNISTRFPGCRRRRDTPRPGAVPRRRAAAGRRAARLLALAPHGLQLGAGECLQYGLHQRIGLGLGCAACRRWPPSAAPASACPRRWTPRRASAAPVHCPAVSLSREARSAGAVFSRPELDQARLAAHLVHVVHQGVDQPRLALALEQRHDLGEAPRIGQRRGRLGRLRRDRARRLRRGETGRRSTTAAAAPDAGPARRWPRRAPPPSAASSARRRAGQVGGVAQPDQRHLGGRERARARAALVEALQQHLPGAGQRRRATASAPSRAPRALAVGDGSAPASGATFSRVSKWVSSSRSCSITTGSAPAS